MFTNNVSAAIYIKGAASVGNSDPNNNFEHAQPYATVDDVVSITPAEVGPLRSSFRVERQKEGSRFVQYVSMNALNNRVDFKNEVDWQTRATMLKAAFNFMFGNDKAILNTFRDQQRKNGVGSYHFKRNTTRQLDTMCNDGWGAPVKPVGLICSAFRPSDDATTFQFLIPSNFMAVTCLNKAAEILVKVNRNTELAEQCRSLAAEVKTALRAYAVHQHPKYGPIYAFEVDGFGNQHLMDDANVPSLLAMAYLGDVSIDDPIYQNTRRFVWSEDNPYFFRGKAGEGIGGPHVGYDMPWPMSIMMKAFTSTDDAEIKWCIETLMRTW